MSEFAELVLSDARDRMDKAIAHSRTEFASVRSGRANPSLVERLSVEAYGVAMRLVEVASISVPEARQLLVTPHDPANLEAIERAIRVSDLGVSPSNDGRSIRLNFPPLTEERRKELVRVVKNMAEDGRISIRNIRREARKDLESAEKDNQLSEDELARAEKELDKLTQASEASVDRALASKEDELLEV
ncbi:MAG: ribosome recycling factor [Acidimicrobiia bacterium]|nr:ribosome recycling factor [Acidimicrobiia bacterium]